MSRKAQSYMYAYHSVRKRWGQRNCLQSVVEDNSSSFSCLKDEKLFAFASFVAKRKKEKEVLPSRKVIPSIWYNYFKIRWFAY